MGYFRNIDLEFSAEIKYGFHSKRTRNLRAKIGNLPKSAKLAENTGNMTPTAEKWLRKSGISGDPRKNERKVREMRHPGPRFLTWRQKTAEIYVDFPEGVWNISVHADDLLPAYATLFDGFSEK